MANISKRLDKYLLPGKHIHLIGIGGVSMRPLGLVLRDNVENGEWLLRMEDGDEIKEICRSSTNPEWGYIEYNDGIRTYKGFAHSDYYSVYK